MDPGHGKMRMNVEGDRLTNLPHDLIHKILSFLKLKEAIRTSVLSSRWWFFWTTMPSLKFSTKDFSSLPEFSKFVTHVLSRRNNSSEVYSVTLTFRGKASQGSVKRVLNYAFSHNIQKLYMVWLLEKCMEFPLSLFSSQSLKHLYLRMVSTRRYHHFNCGLTSTWELPSLTTLSLHSIALCDDEAEKCVGVLSKCANLKDLTLNAFTTIGSNGFSIIHPRLSNLTLVNGDYNVWMVNVVAPQLKNLTIRSCAAKHVISAPHLASLIYKGCHPLNLSTDGFHFLEKADICVSHPQKADAHKIVCLLQYLHSVKYLTLNLEIVELLSSSVDPLLHQPSPFVDLKSLKIYPEIKYLLQQEPKKVAMSTELKSYLLDGSPRATFTMVLREELAAHKHMAELRVLLEKEKHNINTNSPQAPVESHTPEAKEKPKIGGNMEQLKGYLENLLVQTELRTKTACLLISKLQGIGELLTTLPASNRAKIQPKFSSLCAEVNIAISKLTDCVKIQCDESQSRSSVCLHELATMLQSS